MSHIYVGLAFHNIRIFGESNYINNLFHRFNLVITLSLCHVIFVFFCIIAMKSKESSNIIQILINYNHAAQ